MSAHLLLAPGLGTAPPLAGLLGRLARRHAVYAHDPGLGPPAAVLTRPASRWPVPRDAAVAWWIEHPAEVPDVAPNRVRLILTPRPVVEASPALSDLFVPVEVVPAPSIDGTTWRPVAPFVRARWRRRLGLPDVLVAKVGTPGAPAMEERTANDALFLCSAAVVGPGHVLRALALGTPTVCDAATADIIGAVDGTHVIVAGLEQAPSVAAELGADLVRAAALSRAGRRLIEERHDVAAAARRVATWLDLPPVGAPPVAALATVLDDLGTPPDATVVARVAGAVGVLGPGGVDVAVKALRW